ncbi:MAG TPA: hypothetical protein VKV27_14220 [Solirubrobacteraceae bacterium]|nr:hypothetical protein [Solirubrobacteraceae bacterium]
MELDSALHPAELRRYLNRIGDRWPLRTAILAGARVDDVRGAPPQRERGPEYVVLLISAAFEGMPWLERVYQATSLWDGLEMGDVADVHCYTPAEFERKRATTPRVRAAVERGLLLFHDTGDCSDREDAGAETTRATEPTPPRVHTGDRDQPRPGTVPATVTYPRP